MGCYFSRNPLKTLIFQGVLCYNEDMKNEVNITTSNTEMMTISRAEYESLKAERDELNQKLDWLMEQMRLTKKKVYGASSEQTKEELIGQLSFMFDETEAWLPTRRAATRESKVAAHTRQKRSSRVEEVLPGNVPVEVVEHHVPESERACPECGTLMTEIGNEVRRTLVMIPAQVKIREDVYFTYACQNCKQTGTETPILKAEKEPPPDFRQLRLPRGGCPHYGSEVCDVCSAVPAGTGVEPCWCDALPADDVQLGAAGGGGLAAAHL